MTWYSLDNDFERIVDSFVLVGAIPMNIGGFELSHESAEPIKFDATFKYQYWKAGAIGGGSTREAGVFEKIANFSTGVGNIAGGAASIGKAAAGIGNLFR